MNKKKTIFQFPLILVCLLVTACAIYSPLQRAVIQDDVEAVRRAIDEGADVNAPNVNGDTPLILAIFEHNKEMVRLLLDKGADPNIISSENWGNRTPRQIADAALARKGLLDPLTPAHTEDYKAIVQMLRAAETEGPPQEKAKFEQAVQMYRTASTKPVFPEEARKYKVQAEAAVRDRQFKQAADAYRKALDVAPWWPEGYFNRALVLSEIGDYKAAVREMKRYLILVPNAANARAAQDKIYDWEGKVGSDAGGDTGSGWVRRSY
ncbi:MAG: ankyrin repeat domain-containing protein [Gammaproteobacteria bacterium]|nr:ankyrin repeat domain-containing protein [Gammaproteobacteria bacterium]